MKIKQLALLTLSLSVTVTTAVSAPSDDKLLQALQPGRRAGAVNQPPPPAVKPAVVAAAVAPTEPVIVMPTPVSATPARNVTPKIIVPPPAPVATVGRDGKSWTVTEGQTTKQQGWIQETPVRSGSESVSQATVTTPVHETKSTELMDIQVADNVPEAVTVSAPASISEPQPVRTAQNPAPIVPMVTTSITTVGRDGKRWVVKDNAPQQTKPSVIAAPVSDNETLEFVTIDAADSKANSIASTAPLKVVEPEPKRNTQDPASIVASQPASINTKAVTSNSQDGELLNFVDMASDSEPMTVSTPIQPKESKQATLLVDTRPLVQPVSASVKSDALSKTDEKVQKDILNWVVTDTSLAAPENGQGIGNTPGYATKPPVAGKGIPSVEFVKSTVRQALNFSPEIRNAQASFTAAKYDVDEIKGTRWPQVKVGANSPVSNFGSGTRNNNSSDVSDTSGSVSVTTTVFDFGKTGSGIQSAEELSKSSLQAVKLTRNQIAYQTIEGLLALDKFQKDIKVAKTYEKRMSDLVNMLSQITQTDKGRGSELVQARSKLLQAQTNVQQLESNWRDTQIKMTRLLGREIQLPDNLEWNESNISSGSILASLDNHPQIQRMKAEVQASLHKADAIKSSSYPNINWVVSKSTAKDTYGDEQSWYTGINVEWDLFTGGSASASQAAAVQRAQATQMQFETTVLELKYKIRSMIQLRDSAFERAKEYRALSSETDRVRTMFYEQWYYLGKRSLLDVLTAENDHFNNQISAINNEFDGYTANINIMAESAMLLGWLNMPVY
ncbi:TolC family protein [Budviciaceae bacterium CWB-B4]|uniref:TolC family protein n=1 Tax=Limnobaculum xujianqingii TaxID=2738837 RepID=A0A9D7FVX1_9GAMM|nr:TolC family protein [Limnobaculum xujianqingii]MBK5074736.1 TolC family protein [Limnobaculum xujianqingii]MBK5177932.1 TolC family protein [Limnobaculum xujianqingii]